jgi:competence protein ComEC
LNNSDIKIISVGNGNIIKSILFKIKNYFVLNIKSLISEPEASLLIGIILGEKSGIDKDLQNVFRIVGLSHVVALSGYNITIVSDAISKFFTFVPGLWGPIFGIVGVILFVVMSGASTTAIRAGIMAL